MNPTLQRAVDLVCAACPDVAGIYLYGSFDSPYRRDESDLDLAILSPHPLGAVACWNLAQDIAVAVDRDVDVVDLQAASTVLRFQIISTGRRVFCADEPFCEQFEDTVYSMYLHFNEEREAILQDILRRRKVY